MLDGLFLCIYISFLVTHMSTISDIFLACLKYSQVMKPRGFLDQNRFVTTVGSAQKGHYFSHVNHSFLILVNKLRKN